jgi:sodium transport system ATP-binding protein
MEPSGPAFERGLWADNLWRAYGGTHVLRGLSMQVAPGEVVGLLGPNGAGKSTALRLITGLAGMDQGRARVGGVEVADAPEDARAHLGFLAQDTLLYARHSVRETLGLFAGLQGMPEADAERAADAWLGRLELGPLRDRMVGTLSSGERQRTNLARALVHNPDVVILDEPTVALDPETVDLLLRVVRELRAEGKAILLCTHALADAELVVDRAVLLLHGRVMAEGTLEALHAQTGTRTLNATFLQLVRVLRESRTADTAPTTPV